MLNQNEIQRQVELYFSVLHDHPEGLKGGVFTHMKKNRFKEQYSLGYDKSIEHIEKLLNEGDRAVFVTLNSYKKDHRRDFYCKRDDNHLWGIDTIMIDLDAPTQLLGVEDEVIEILKWAWELNKIPKPNLYSYTGSGGIHLYYCFERLPKTMQQSINALKWGIAEKIISFEKDFPSREGYSHKVDTKIFDNQRLDRVPGSIHEDTGVMCTCYSTNQPRYKYKDFLQFFDEDSWSSEYKIKDAQLYISKLRGETLKTDTLTSTPTKDPTSQKTLSNPLKTETKTSDTLKERQLLQKRINALFTLAKNGKDFKNCREMSCFFLRNWCQQLSFSEEKTQKYLYKFNSYFKDPLSEKELLNNTCSNKFYKFSNQYIKNTLNLTDEEMKVFSKKYRPGDRKERTLIDKINIAKLLIKGYSSDKICEELSISLSLLKRRRTEMKKAEGLEFWANYKIPHKNPVKLLTAIVKTLQEKKKVQSDKLRNLIENIINKKQDCYNSVYTRLLKDVFKHFEIDDFDWYHSLRSAYT